MQSFAAVAPVDFISEIDVCGFGLSVRGPRAVAAVLEVVVPELDACRAVTHGGERHDTGVEVCG